MNNRFINKLGLPVIDRYKHKRNSLETKINKNYKSNNFKIIKITEFKTWNQSFTLEQ